MDVRAVAKYVRVQPRKVRLVASEVRGKSARAAADLLRFHPSKGARALRKVLISAMANAQENHGANPDTLRILKISVDEGPRLKRIRPRAMGRVNRILKKTSHITVVVEEFDGGRKVKPHGTKPKPRPSFDKPKSKKKKKDEPIVEETAAAEGEDQAEEPSDGAEPVDGEGAEGDEKETEDAAKSDDASEKEGGE